jgi:curli production assembly/transport component CsgG
MIRPKNCVLTVLLGLALSCGSYFNQPVKKQNAKLGESTPVTNKLFNLPKPKKKIVAGVYNFRDQTGQYKALENGSTFSTAISQGATTMLIKALEDSNWFTAIERENLGNLLNERKIIRTTRDEYSKTKNKKEAKLPALLYAGVLLEGGIISYDTNILTGGLGARYFGVGGSSQYRQDRISVYLRAVSTSNGKILKTVYVSKTILSQAISVNLFKYVSFQRLLEAETGFTKNEPVQLAMKEAIEKAVESLILEGIQDDLWQADINDTQKQELLTHYNLEKEEALSTDIHQRFLKPRRGVNVVTGALGTTLINGDLQSPELEFNGRVGAKHYFTPYLNLGFTYNKFNLSNKNLLNEGYMSFDFDLEYNLLPYDRFTPFLFGGAGVNASNYFIKIDPKIQFGVGFEYLIKDNIGVYGFGQQNYVFSDEIDNVVAGKQNDLFYRFGVGVNIYFTNSNKQKNEKREALKAQRKVLKSIRKNADSQLLQNQLNSNPSNN